MFLVGETDFEHTDGRIGCPTNVAETWGAFSAWRTGSRPRNRPFQLQTYATEAPHPLHKTTGASCVPIFCHGHLLIV